MKISFDIITNVLADGKIEQSLYSTKDNIKTLMMKQVADTLDLQIREGLIKLGWAPPKDK